MPKLSALPVATTFGDTDIIVINVGGVTSKMTVLQFRTLLAYQAYSANLLTLASITPSAIGQALLALSSPGANSYSRFSSLGVPSLLTASQVMADLIANAAGVDRTTAQLLSNKDLNGARFAVGIATTPDATATTIDAPTDVYLIRFIKVGGFTGGSIDFQFQGSCRPTFPKGDYVIATVAGVRPTSDDTKASASTVNLDAADGTQIDISGTTTINAFTLAENVERIVRFTGATTLVNSANLVLPGLANIATTAGDYAIVRGGAAGVVTVLEYKTAGVNIHYGGDFYTGSTFRAINGVSLVGSFSYTSPNTLSLLTTDDSTPTFPEGSHLLLARDGYATTPTAAGTTVLTLASQYQQFFTGATTQTVTLPVVTTLPRTGFTFRIVNLSSGNVTVQSSGGNSVVVLAANTSAILTCILLTGTTAASWSAI